MHCIKKLVVSQGVLNKKIDNVRYEVDEFASNIWETKIFMIQASCINTDIMCICKVM
jgi:hypothetical protein